MKNKMLWIGSVIILILSVICFVVFGVGTEIIKAVTGDAGKISFGKYNGKEIVLEPNTEFANAVNNFTSNAQEQKQNSAHPELEDSDYFYIYNYAFNATVQSLAYKNAVKSSGYKPSTKAVSTAMLPFFLNADGKYDPRLYSALSNSDKESVKSEVTTMLTWKRFGNDMFGGENYFGDIIACLSNYRTAFYFDTTEKIGKYALYGLKSSEKESDFLASLDAEKRSIEAVAFNKADYPDSEVRKFGSENLSLFDTYSLSMITVKEESQAKKLLSQLSNNEITFKDAVTEYSEKYYSDGDGIVKQNYSYQVKENLENEADFSQIESLAKDALSEVIKTNKGYSIYKCTGEKTSADLENTETFDVVRNYITTNNQDSIESYFTEKAKSFVATAQIEGFSKAAVKSGIETVSFEAFPLNYGNVSIATTFDSNSSTAFANASSNEDFLTKVFSMKKDEISEPVVLGNYVGVIHLVDIRKDTPDSSRTESIASEVTGYDQTEAQTTLLSSSKVDNQVMNTYFNKFHQR